MDLSYKEKGKDVRHNPLKYYVTGDGTAIGIYQGFRGENPDLYERTEPFNSVDERNNYELLFYPTFDYDSLNQHGYYSIETLTAFIELFTKCEKQTTGAFMFKTLLQLVKDYCDGKKDFYQIVGYSKRV